jgi:hypothetical protein
MFKLDLSTFDLSPDSTPALKENGRLVWSLRRQGVKVTHYLTFSNSNPIVEKSFARYHVFQEETLVVCGRFISVLKYISLVSLVSQGRNIPLPGGLNLCY